MILDAFALEEKVIEHEINDMNIHELRDDLSKQKITIQLFLFQGRNDIDGKLVETIMPFKNNEAFETYLENRGEHFDGESIIVQETDFFKKKQIRKSLKKSNEVNMVKRVTYNVRKCF